jgi:hypothetical protein
MPGSKVFYFGALEIVQYGVGWTFDLYGVFIETHEA